MPGWAASRKRRRRQPDRRRQVARSEARHPDRVRRSGRRYGPPPRLWPPQRRRHRSLLDSNRRAARPAAATSRRSAPRGQHARCRTLRPRRSALSNSAKWSRGRAVHRRSPGRRSRRSAAPSCRLRELSLSPLAPHRFPGGSAPGYSPAMSRVRSRSQPTTRSGAFHISTSRIESPGSNLNGPVW